jgi:MOSC domain-containing protein YiiM
VRKSWATSDKKPHPEMQINIMNARAIALIAQTKDRWQLAGDQFYVDLDLSEENLPPKSRLKIGSAILEITEVPHNGCIKFTKRFGKDSVKFVNSKIGKQLHLRGLNAKVIKSGTVKTGDIVKKI